MTRVHFGGSANGESEQQGEGLRQLSCTFVSQTVISSHGRSKRSRVHMQVSDDDFLNVEGHNSAHA